MKLTKEMCEEALKVLEKEKLESMADVVDKVGALGVVDELIKEHFELVEKFNWLKDCFSGETFNLIFTDKKSVEDWFERMKWHVKKCNELSSELRELKSNPALKFEELHKGMWVYDKKLKIYSKISKMFDKLIEFSWNNTVLFEENRFFRKEVK